MQTEQRTMKTSSLFETMAQGVDEERARMLAAANEEANAIVSEAREIGSVR